MQTLAEQLRDECERWQSVSRAACLVRTFVLRNGREYTGQRLPSGFRRRRAKLCFMHSARLALEDARLTYVEGYARVRGTSFAFEHAWVSGADGRVIDVTLKNPEHVEYVGVPFDQATLGAQLSASGVYGLFDHGRGINVELLFSRDPELPALFPG